MNDSIPFRCAALYRRVSTGKQESSLEVQESKLLSYLTFQGLTATDETTFYDEAVSGSVEIEKRPGGSKLFAALRTNAEIRHVVVSKLDRLGRSAIDLKRSVEEFNKLGIVLHIVDMGGESLSTSGPAGKMMLGILGEFAEFERAMIQQRIKDTIEKRFGEHRLIGTVPYGYTLAEDGTSLLDNEAEQKVIQDITRWRDDMKMSFNAIAKHLNAAGIPTKTGKGKWQCGNVAGVYSSKHTARFLGDKQSQSELEAA